MGGELLLLVSAVASLRARIGVYPRMPGQFVGSRKPLAASSEGAGMGFLARVGAEVPRLMF
jgi:hypothetical protein